MFSFRFRVLDLKTQLLHVPFLGGYGQRITVLLTIAANKAHGSSLGNTVLPGHAARWILPFV